MSEENPEPADESVPTPVPDAAVPDVAVPDAAVPDVAVPDVAVPDAAVPDAAVPDVAVPDAAVPDVAVPDVAVPDAAVPDVAVPDAAVPDVAVPDATPTSLDAVSPSEAMAHHRSPVEIVATELEELTRAILERAVSLKIAGSRLDSLRAAIAALEPGGAPEHLAGALGEAQGRLQEYAALARAARAAAAEVARAAKDRIVSEAERIAASEQWNVGAERLTVLLEEWKACGRVDRKSDDQLWQRFSTARSTFTKRRKAHYNELSQGRTAARTAKEALAAKAEQLSGSTDWASTAVAYRDLMTAWKAAGRAGRDVDEELWARFRSAQEAFFTARTAASGARDAEQVRNLAAKEELLAGAEALLPVTDPRSARNALRPITERWAAIGPVPPGARSKLEERLAAVEAAVRAGSEASSPQRNSPVRARAEETVAALRESITTLESKADRARAAGDEKRAGEAREAAVARRQWLAEAERTLAQLL